MVQELAVSEFSGVPGGIFTIPKQADDGNNNNDLMAGNDSSIQLSKYIAVSFALL